MRVLLDVDGVVANYLATAVQKTYDVNRALGLETVFREDDFDEWDIDKVFERKVKKGYASLFIERFWAEMGKPGVIESLEPYPGAKVVTRIMSSSSELLFVTSPTTSNPTWGYERTNWIRRMLGFSANHVIITKAKHAVQGDVFVDDKPENVITWQEHNPHGKGLLLDRRYNQNIGFRIPRIENLGKVVELIHGHR